MQPRISVLVPVYNAENYIVSCLQSLSKQTFTDFEIICIDDGSKDNSLCILHDYAKQETRLRVFCQDNAGVAATRNRLLVTARGKYVAFVDADDWVEATYLEKLYQAAEQSKAEVTKCLFKQFNQQLQRFEKPTFLSDFYINSFNSPLKRLRAGRADAMVWGKLYLSNYLRTNKISFLEGEVAEDLGFSVIAFYYASRITMVTDALYVYRRGMDGAITANGSKMTIGSLHNCLYLCEELVKHGNVPKEVMDQLVKYVIWDVCRMRKLPVMIRRKQDLLMNKALNRLHEYLELCSKWGQLRLKILFALAGKPDTHRFYFWTKIFRY